MQEFGKIKTVSSANNLVLILEMYSTSFTLIINNDGLNMEPWGTPHFTCFKSHLALFINVSVR